MISTIFIITYIFMVGFIFYRMRALTSFSHLHCFVIALTSSLPMILNKVASTWEIFTRYLVEGGFILAGTSSDEINQEVLKKLGNEENNE